MKHFFLFLWHLPRRAMIGLISVYQKILSPDHSFWAKTLYPHGYCKFEPSCSDYMKEALHKYGLVRGTVKGTWRILRCNPWTEGGEDLV